MNMVQNAQLFQDLGDYIYKYTYFMCCGCCAGIHVCAPQVCSASRGQKRASNPLQLALQTHWLLCGFLELNLGFLQEVLLTVEELFIYTFRWVT